MRWNRLETGLVVLVASALDRIGEPPAAVHPVVWYGRLIRFLERGTPRSAGAQAVYGVAMLLLATPFALFPAWFIQRFAGFARSDTITQLEGRNGRILSAIIEGFGLKPCFALCMLAKAYALAGLRSGYAISSPHIIERLRTQLPSWNVNSVAQAASIAALQDQQYLHMTLKALAHESRAFFQSLRHAGFSPLPSQTHFFLLHVGDARSIRQQLLARKILVRDCTSFGLPQFIRVATRVANEWPIFVDCLQEVVQCMQRL